MAITNLNTTAGTSVLLAHFDNPNRDDFNMDIYFYYEVVGRNSDNSTRVLTGLYWEFNRDTTQNINPLRGRPGHWYPDPNPDAGELGLAWARGDRGFKVDVNLINNNPYVSGDKYAFDYEILKWNHIDDIDKIFYKDYEVISEPWEEEDDAGLVIQYRKIRCIYREWGYQKEINFMGGTTISGDLVFYDTDNYIADPTTQTITYPTLKTVPASVKLQFSDYISFTTARATSEIYPIEFSLYNPNSTITYQEIYIELVTAEDRNQVIVPRVDLKNKFSTLTKTWYWWDGPEWLPSDGSLDDTVGPVARTFWEYMYDKKESDFYLKLSYRRNTSYPLMTSYAKVHIQLDEIYRGQASALYPVLNYSAKDINPTTKALTGDDSYFVRYFSNVEAKLSVRPMKLAQVVSQGIRTSEAVVGTDYYLFENITSESIKFYATDSRGFSNSISVNQRFLFYVKPTASITGIGLPQVDDTCHIIASGRYWDDSFGKVDNTLTFYYRYKSTSIPEYVDWIKVSNPEVEMNWEEYSYNAQFNVNLPNHVDSFTIQIMAKDKLTQGESGTRTVRAYPIFDWSENDFHFNIPVEIDGDLVVNGVITSNTPVAQQIEPADYIIEQGTRQTGSGNSLANWTFRKWNSGMYECWCRKHIQTGVSTAWGNMYVSGALPHTNLIWPGAFIDIPVANITIAPNASGAFLIAGGSTNLTATNTGGYEIARGTSLSSGNFYINYYGMGRWK